LTNPLHEHIAYTTIKYIDKVVEQLHQ
jgi:hypothetical protein